MSLLYSFTKFPVERARKAHGCCSCLRMVMESVSLWAVSGYHLWIVLVWLDTRYFLFY